MGVTLLIDLDRSEETFYPGEIITGKVTLENDSDLKVKGLTVTFFGDADVYWTEAEVRSDTVSPHRNQNFTSAIRHVHKEFRNQETVLCHEIVLFGQADAKAGSEFILTAGAKEYLFRYQLPFTGLPSTFTDLPYGSIRYSVEARLKRPLFRYDKAEKEFVIKEILDINCVPRTLQPIGIEKRVGFGWVCCPDGYITVDLRLPKTGYTHEETIPFTVSILNSSRVPANQIFAKFTQEIIFSTFDQTKTVAMDMQSTIYQSVVDPFGVATWNASFSVPNQVPPSTLAGCKIISFHYSIKVIAKTSEKSCKVVCPIVVGTKPGHRVSTALELEAEATVSDWMGADHRRTMENNLTKMEYDPALNPFLNQGFEDENEDGLNNNTINEKENNSINTN